MTSPSTADPWELLEARAEIKWLKGQREIDAQVLQEAIQVGAQYALESDRAKARIAELEATLARTGPTGTDNSVADLESICRDIYARWDKDMRSGKLLQALSGTLENYDPRVTRVRAALSRSAPTKTEG